MSSDVVVVRVYVFLVSYFPRIDKMVMNKINIDETKLVGGYFILDSFIF